MTFKIQRCNNVFKHVSCQLCTRVTRLNSHGGYTMYSSDCQCVMSLLCAVRGLSSSVFMSCTFYLCNLPL